MAFCTPLPADALYHRCDPEGFAFATTAELEDFENMLGQGRAVEAIQFGVAVEHDGYNLFVLGPPGTGRHSFVQQFLSQKAADRPTPMDYCYVNNFELPRQPKAIGLPAGKACQFRSDIRQLIEEAHSAIPTAFEGENYRNRRQTIEEAVENVQQFAQLLGTLARRDKLMPLHRTGVARVVEASARYAGDAERLSTQIRKIADIVREAHYWAKEQQRTVIDAEAVQQAIDHQIRRASRIRDQLQQEILRNTILIDTAGQKMGQINGLAVFLLGEYPFAHPSRITARLSLGDGKVIDIEREVELGGPIHSKGVLILSNFLAAHYVTDQPLSLSASLVFEQSYAGVDGDSASAAELCALLSALAKLPIKQSFAVTGSVNQYGEIQAIGAVNDKIEGFFDICQARGLQGDQGVLIPTSNVKHLMLRRDVVEAVDAGQFHIYAVETIDQCMEVLTGLDAGQRDESGNFPERTINHRIVTNLLDYAQKRHKFHEPPSSETDGA